MSNFDFPGKELVPPHLKKPLLAVLAAGVAVWTVILFQFTKKESPAEIAKRITAESDARTAEYLRKTSEETARVKLQNAQREEERQLKLLTAEKQKEQEAAEKARKTAEDARNREIAKAEREKEELALKQKRDSDRQALVDLRLKEKMEMAQKKAEKDQTKVEENAIQQEERTKLAERLFTGITIEPHVTLSPKLKGMGTSVEIKGDALPPIHKLYQERDWLGLYNLADRSKSKELPMDSLIGFAVKKLEDINSPLLLKTPFKKQGDEDLIGLFISKYTNGSLSFGISYASRGGAKVHPDGNGYIFDWKIGKHDVFFLTGGDAVSKRYRKFEAEHQEEMRQHKSRRRLSEITQEEYDAVVAKAAANVVQRIAAWVASGAQ